MLNLEQLLQEKKFDKLYAYSLERMFYKFLYKEQKVILERILENLPTDDYKMRVRGMQYLGFCYFTLGQRDRGIKILEKSLVIFEKQLTDLVYIYIETIRILLNGYYDIKNRDQIMTLHDKLSSLYG